MGHVAHVDGGAVDGLDRQVVEFVEGFGAVVELHVVFELADLGGAGGDDQVLVGDGGLDILGRQAFGLQRRGIEVDLDLAHLAAVGRGGGGAGNGGQRRADEVLGRVVDLLLAQGRAGIGDLQDRHGGGAVVQHLGRGDAGRHLLQHRLRDRGHLGGGGADVGAGLEEDLHDAHAGQRLAFDMLDIVDGEGEGALVVVDHPPGHVVGGQAVIGPHHRHHGDIDVGQDVGGRARGGQRTGQQDEQRHDDERQRPSKRDPNKLKHGDGPLTCTDNRSSGCGDGKIGR